jgi:hypothetical protein
MRGPFVESRLNRDYSDVLSALCAEGAEFLIVGAYAVGVHGIPRATGDIDVWVRPTSENAKRVMRALKRFGATLLDLTLRRPTPFSRWEWRQIALMCSQESVA